MKNKYIFSVVVLMLSVGLNAQIMLEDFSTHTVGGPLEGINGWVQGTPTSSESSRLKGESPLIAAGSLSFSNYVGSGKGNVVVVDPASVARKSLLPIVLDGNSVMPVPDEKIYMAGIVSFMGFDTVTVYREVFNFNKENATTDRGRIYAKVEDDNSTIRIGFSKGSNSEISESISLEGLQLTMDQPILFVIVNHAISGSSNDEFSLIINPDLTKPEAEQAYVLQSPSHTAQSDMNSTNSQYIAIRQNGAGFKLGGLAVSKSWEALYEESTGIRNASYNDGKIWSDGSTIYTSEIGKLVVYNLAGTEVFATDTNGSVDTSLTKGLYLVKFVGEAGQISSAKVLVK